MSLDNIGEVVKAGLCTGCGTCAGVCPASAIGMQVSNGLFLPQIDLAKCTSCGLCLECCSGCSVDFEKLNLWLFGKKPEDELLGNYLQCYVGHSNNDGIRFGSSSGGIATQLLILALENGIIDGAIVARMRKDRPLETEAFIARTSEEIISASKSKYCPVAPNEALERVLREKGKFAIVGLPCHIHGIRKAEDKISSLRDKMVLHIGLMCSHTVSFCGTEFLLGKLGVSSDQVAEISYRGKGWPGRLHVKLKDGSDQSIPYVGKWRSYWPIFSCSFFTPFRCFMCPDETNELADISLGDAWLAEFKRERIGESIIVTRTKSGQDIADLACRSKLVSLRSVTGRKVRQSQTEPLKFKKEDLSNRLVMIQSTKTKIPEFNLVLKSRHSILTSSRNLFLFFNQRVSEKETFRRLLGGIPYSVFRLYNGIYRLLCVF